jgi:hypothetical protein
MVLDFFRRRNQEKMELILTERSDGSYGAPALHGILTASAAAGGDHQEFLQLRKGHWPMARLVGKHAIRDFCSHEKAPGTSSH